MFYKRCTITQYFHYHCYECVVTCLGISFIYKRNWIDNFDKLNNLECLINYLRINKLVFILSKLSDCNQNFYHLIYVLGIKEYYNV